MNVERVVVTFEAPGREPFVAVNTSLDELLAAARAKLGPAEASRVARHEILSLWIECDAHGRIRESSVGWLDPSKAAT